MEEELRKQVALAVARQFRVLLLEEPAGRHRARWRAKWELSRIYKRLGLLQENPPGPPRLPRRAPPLPLELRAEDLWPWTILNLYYFC